MQICNNCHAGCCRKFNVHLTGFDIIRLKKTLGLDYIQFSQVMPIKNENIDEVIQHTPLFRFTNFGEKEYFAFYLRRLRSKYMPDSFKCMFLQEWSGDDFLLPNADEITARCGIYNIRPLTCATFPAKLHEDGLTGLAGNPTKGNISGNPAYDLCPRLLDEDDLADHSGDTIQSLVLYKYEMEYFRSVAEAWNKNPGDYAKFLAYLELVYRNRVLFSDLEKVEQPV